jgi:tetratricopeptide (TPR) repeat protein
MTSTEALNLALQYHQAGDLPRAEGLYRQILQGEPGHADALHLLGVVAAQQGRRDLGLRCIAQAVTLCPHHAIYQHNLGLTLQDLGRLPEAMAAYERALQLRPHYADAHFNLGRALQVLGRLDEAVTRYQEALRYRPEHAGSWNNLGNVLKDLGRLDEAEASCRRALALQPQDAEGHNNLGNMLKLQGRTDEALQSFETAVRLKAELPEAHWNLATTLLLLGDFERGWVEYEWRQRCRALPMPTQRGPVWDGGALAGKRILLRAEQGLGDTLQFIRYAALLKRRGATVLLECQKPLAEVLSGCAGVDGVVVQGAPLPEFDVEVPLLSLPGLFRTTLSSIPAQVPYLSPDPERLGHWGTQLRLFPGFRIGIVWKGSDAYWGDRIRSVPLAAFAPLAGLEGVSLLALQVGPGREQLAAPGALCAVSDLGSRFDPTSFADAAAAVKNLDLVVTVDTAMAHLAGALAVPVWVLLPFAGEWRWLLEREDSAWYPTARLFRQPHPGDWAAVFVRVAGEVRKRVAEVKGRSYWVQPG